MVAVQSTACGPILFQFHLQPRNFMEILLIVSMNRMNILWEWIWVPLSYHHQIITLLYIILNDMGISNYNSWLLYKPKWCGNLLSHPIIRLIEKMILALPMNKNYPISLEYIIQMNHY
jgi:hypothetical protein